MSIPKFLACVCAAGLWLAGGASAETWRWRDAEGNQHFGDQPPAGVEAERLNIKRRPSELSPQDRTQRLERLRADEASRNAKREATQARAGRDADELADKRAGNRQRCDRARWALAALETARPVYRDENGAYRVKRSPNEPDIYPGAREYLDDAERQGEIARYRRDMEGSCADTPALADKRLAEEELRHAESCEFAEASLRQLEQPEARATPEEIAGRRRFLEAECWAP